MGKPGVLGKRGRPASVPQPTIPPSAPQPTTPAFAKQPRNGPRIVVNGKHAVSLRRFDKGAGKWEVESAGGVVSFVPKASLALDLGLPPLPPGASPMSPSMMNPLSEPLPGRGGGGCGLQSGQVGDAGLDPGGHVCRAPHRTGVSGAIPSECFGGRRVEAACVQPWVTDRVGRGRSIILEEQPVMRGAEEICLGMRTPEAKAIIQRFLALPQVPTPPPDPCNHVDAQFQGH